MTNYYKSTLDLIGNTPLVEVTNIENEQNLEASVLVKLEYFNPGGSIKDRIAKAMIEDAESRGALKEGSVIIEPTSGNTGIGLAAIAAAKGYRIILTMPETMSVERRNILKAYGAELVLTDGAKGMKGAIARAQELAAEIPDSFIPGQFENPANPAAHRAATGSGGEKDLARYRRKNRYLCSRSGNRRNDHRSRRILKRAEPGYQYRGCRTGRLSGSL